MIDVGRLNKRISFLEYSTYKNELEQEVQEYIKVKKVWASVEPVSGKEYYNANKVENQTAYTVYVRYTEGIKPDMLIRYKSKKLYIKEVLNIMEKKELLKIICFEKEGDYFE